MRAPSSRCACLVCVGGADSGAGQLQAPRRWTSPFVPLGLCSDYASFNEIIRGKHSAQSPTPSECSINPVSAARVLGLSRRRQQSRFMRRTAASVPRSCRPRPQAPPLCPPPAGNCPPLPCSPSAAGLQSPSGPTSTEVLRFVQDTETGCWRQPPDTSGHTRNRKAGRGPPGPPRVPPR